MDQQQESKREIHLRDYWQILVRRRWLIYTCVIVTTVAATVASFLATPIYQAGCTIKIERQSARVLQQDFLTTSTSWLDYQNFYNTQYQIISSDAVLRDVAERLDVLNRPSLTDDGEESFFDKISAFKNKIVRTLSGAPEPTESDDPLLRYVNMLRGGLSVTPLQDSFLVEISFVSADPQFAAEVSNTVADAYRHFALNEKFDLAQQSSEWFVERLGELQDDVADLEKAQQQYAAENDLVVGGDGANIEQRDVEDLRNQLMSATKSAAQARAKMDSIRGSEPASLQAVQDDPIVKELQRQIADDESEYAKTIDRYGLGVPEVRDLKTSLESKKAQLASRIDKIKTTEFDLAKNEYDLAIREETNLDWVLQDKREELAEAEQALITWNTINAQVLQKRKTLDELLTRKSQMELSATLGETGHNVRTIDPAIAPKTPFKPQKRLNIMLGLIFGVALGIGASVLMEYIDNTIKNPDDVRAVMGVPVLGMIPAAEAVAKTRTRRERAADQKSETEIDPALITSQAPLSPLSESYRELRTALLLATAGHPPRDVTVTSCQPSEGKTTTAMNVAIALAQLGKRVLIVDSDLRRPRCHRVLKLSSGRGVSNFLTGSDDLENFIQPTGVERLSLLASGPVPPNPSELLDSARFIEMRDLLRDGGGRPGLQFDHVIYDSPPVLSVVDPLLIGRHTEGTVLVVRSAFTSREAGRLGKEKLESGRVNLLGVLLNAVQTEHVPYQYRYYRYGSGEAEEQEGGGSDENVAARGRKSA